MKKIGTEFGIVLLLALTTGLLDCWEEEGEEGDQRYGYREHFALLTRQRNEAHRIEYNKAVVRAALRKAEAEKSSSSYNGKEYLPKDASKSGNRKAMIQMQSQISSMERSMAGLRNGTGELKIQAQRELIPSLQENMMGLERLTRGFYDMRRVLSTHNKLLEELMDQIGPNDKTFAVSNMTCGGVLFARSGHIAYSRAAMAESDNVEEYQPLHCVWTVQAGHFSQIKIMLDDLKLPPNFEAYAVELLKAGDGEATLETTRTRLLSRVKPEFLQGPIGFIVLTRNDSDMASLITSSSTATDGVISLGLEYEGRGKVEQKRTQFFHHQLPAHNGSGSFTDTDFGKWRDQALEDYYRHDKEGDTYPFNFTRTVGTVTFSNFSTRVVFKLGWDRRECTEEGFFMVVSDLLGNGTSLTDLCKTNDTRWKEGVTLYGTPVTFLIGMSSENRLPFRVEWKAENPLPNNYFGPRRGHKCGGVLGGTGGILSFRTEDASTKQSIRCVWVIRPQPFMRSFIAIRNVRQGPSGGSSSLQHLYLAQLTDINGTGLPSPKRLTSSRTFLWGNYGWSRHPTNGREIYVIFQAPPVKQTLTSNATFLYFEWAMTGAILKGAGEDMISPEYTWRHDDTGSLPITDKPDQIYILQRPPVSPGGIQPEMKLELNLTSPSSMADETACPAVYTASSSFIIQNSPCQPSGNDTTTIIENLDGIAVIMVGVAKEGTYENQTDSNNNNNATLTYKWSQDKELTLANDHCGGVITRRSGLLNYKLDEKYQGNERCIWLIHTPNCSRMRLDLIRNGFYGTRYLVANTVDGGTGSLSNASVVLSSKSPTQTISEGLAILLFQTHNGSTSGTGFALQYTGLECTTTGGGGNPPPIHYHLQHVGSSHHNFSYKVDDEDEEGPSKVVSLYVIAYSEPVHYFMDTYKASTVIDFQGGIFHQRESCDQQDSIKFYAGTEVGDPTFAERGHLWEERLRYPPGLGGTMDCPRRTRNLVMPGRTNAFQTKFLAFLAIYRVLPVTASLDDAGNIGTGLLRRRSVEFLRRKVNGSSSSPTTTTTTTTTGYQRRVIIPVRLPVGNGSSSEEDNWWQ